MIVRSLSLSAVIVGCSGLAHAGSLKHLQTPPPDMSNPQHVFPAFGGKLLGVDNGEWGGALGFQSANGQIELLVRDNYQRRPPVIANVVGIVKNRAGIFVFTGLSHGFTQGRIYTVARGSDQNVRAKVFMDLVGKPVDITTHPDGSTTFLVTEAPTECRDATSFRCMVLTQKSISPSKKCPNPAPAN